MSGNTPRRGRGGAGNKPRGGGNTPRGEENTPRGGGNTPRGGGNTSRGGANPQPDAGQGRGQGGDGQRGGASRGRGGGYKQAFRSGPAEVYKLNAYPEPSATVQKIEDALVAGNTPQKLKGLSLEPVLPVRPSYGKMGKPVVLRTNYFNIVPARKDIELFGYSITIKPEPSPTRRWARTIVLLMETAPFLQQQRGYVASDHRATLVTPQKLDLGPNNSMTHVVNYYEVEEAGPPSNEERQKFFECTVTYQRTVSVEDLVQYLTSTDRSVNIVDKEMTMQLLNIAMTRKPWKNPNVSAGAMGSKFFMHDAFLGDLGGGLEALRGFYSSVRTATGRLLLNVNSITGTFYQSGELVDLIREFRKTNIVDSELQRFLRGVRVSLKHLKTRELQKPKNKVIHALSIGTDGYALGANRQKFHWSSKNKDVTVEQYFKEQYNRNLSRPDMPVLNLGNSEHPNWTPAELCLVLPGQSAKKKLSSSQTQNMIRYACRKPHENARFIVDHDAEVIGLGRDYNDGPTRFGLRIVPEMCTVSGRVLMPPTLIYKEKKAEVPRFGGWNMTRVKFFRGSHIKRWSYLRIMYTGDHQTVKPLGEMVQTFRAQMIKCGLTVDPPHQPTTARGRGAPPGGCPIMTLQSPSMPVKQMEEEVMKFLSNVPLQELDTLLIILPSKNATLYAVIKYICDVHYGLATVCCQLASLEQGDPQYLANVALKWNLKHGGLNQQLQDDKLGILAKGTTMVVGIDVTHPSPDSRKSAPSVAGVVASINKHLAIWPGSIRCQESRKEIVSGLEEMFVERLRCWQTHNSGRLPEQILVYRDGVSEGQYTIVQDLEGGAFARAIEKLYPKNARAKVSIIIVGKRHHTRFYPVKANEMDKSGNPQNGTVVDRGVTNERNWDFFLQAHKGLQGTARPAHYIVVQDQIGLRTDGLEQLTHNLCYTFGRATMAVSICPPAYYADLLCERGRCYLYDVFNRQVATRESETFNLATARWAGGVNERLKNTMFYI